MTIKEWFTFNKTMISVKKLTIRIDVNSKEYNSIDEVIKDFGDTKIEYTNLIFSDVVLINFITKEYSTEIIRENIRKIVKLYGMDRVIDEIQQIKLDETMETMGKL